MLTKQEVISLKGSKKTLNKHLKVFIIIVGILITILIILQSGMIYIHNKGTWKPNYEKKDIRGILYKQNLTDEEYNLIFAQTGISRKPLDVMRKNNRYDDILSIQEAYFKNFPVQHEVFAPFTCSDRMSVNIPLIPLEDGDIIVSPSSHVSYLKSGHAAIVINAKEGRILNATGYDYPSSVEDITELNCRPAFIVLRLKATSEKRSEIDRYALENLNEINYSLIAGIFDKYKDGNVKATHCGHLIWYAFNRFGYNLDSNGGLAVWPEDIANSEYLEVMQIYGVNPNNFWK